MMRHQRVPSQTANMNDTAHAELIRMLQNNKLSEINEQ